MNHYLGPDPPPPAEKTPKCEGLISYISRKSSGEGGAAVELKRIVIGENVKIGKGTVVGELPLNLEQEGPWKKRKAVNAGIVIGDDVDIGANSVICYGCEEDTLIEEHCWIGHQCLIGHDAKIGKGSIICSGVSILGHVEIGEYCYIAPRSVIRNRMRVGKNTVIGLGSVVTTNIPESVVAYGAPCKVVRKNEGGIPR